MVPIAIAITLPHHGFGAIVLAFHKAMRKACGQKLEKGENFLSPILKSGEGFPQVLRPMPLNLLDPGIQFHCCRVDLLPGLNQWEISLLSKIQKPSKTMYKRHSYGAMQKKIPKTKMHLKKIFK